MFTVVPGVPGDVGTSTSRRRPCLTHQYDPELVRVVGLGFRVWVSVITVTTDN